MTSDERLMPSVAGLASCAEAVPAAWCFICIVPPPCIIGAAGPAAAPGADAPIAAIANSTWVVPASLDPNSADCRRVPPWTSVPSAALARLAQGGDHEKDTSGLINSLSVIATFSFGTYTGLAAGDSAAGQQFGPRGYDAGKKVNGRKRHALVDPDGRGLVLEPHPASIQDRDGGGPLLRVSRRIFPFIQRVFADSGYAGEKVTAATLIAIEIVRKNPDQVG